MEHKAKVVSVEPPIVEVEMTVEDACSSCRAKEVCGAGTAEHRIVAVHDTFASSYHVGEEVLIEISEIMGAKAATYAYIIPFFIMLAVLFVLKSMEVSDLITGLSALGAAGLYYLVLWFFRKRIEKVIIFKIKKI